MNNLEGAFVWQIKTTKPDNFTPKIVKQTDDYVYVEYSSPLVGVSLLSNCLLCDDKLQEEDMTCCVVQFVDDVEFWFPPGHRSLVEYRSASRTEGIGFGSTGNESR